MCFIVEYKCIKKISKYSNALYPKDMQTLCKSNTHEQSTIHETFLFTYSTDTTPTTQSYLLSLAKKRKQWQAGWGGAGGHAVHGPETRALWVNKAHWYF